MTQVRNLAMINSPWLTCQVLFILPPQCPFGTKNNKNLMRLTLMSYSDTTLSTRCSLLLLPLIKKKKKLYIDAYEQENMYVLNVQLNGFSQTKHIRVSNIQIELFPWLHHLENLSDWQTWVGVKQPDSNLGCNRVALFDLRPFLTCFLSSFSSCGDWEPHIPYCVIAQFQGHAGDNQILVCNSTSPLVSTTLNLHEF